MKEFEGGRPEGVVWNCAIEEEMNSQVSLESEQTLRTERSVRSVGKERVIILFNSIILQRDWHFVDGFVNFERRSNNDHPNTEQRYLEVLEEERKNLARPG